jgi:hypothetical protein
MPPWFRPQVEKAIREAREAAAVDGYVPPLLVEQDERGAA